MAERGSAPPGLYAALAASWPAAETLDLGPWRLRFSREGGRRASAATLEGACVIPAEAEAAIRSRGKRPTFMIRDGELDLDTALATSGYRLEGKTVIYVAAPAEIASRAADLAVIDCDGPIAILAELWAEAGLGPERLELMARLDEPKRFLLGRLDDRTAGAAFVSRHGPVAVLNAVVVAARARRRGLGRRIGQWAASWAGEQGAETLALAVEADNVAARALWTGLGMRLAGGYHYRIAPD